MLSNDNMLTASNVANKLNISVKTLTTWYKWYYDNTIEKPKDFPKLPEYIQDHVNGPRYWTESDVKKLEEFKSWIPRGRAGVMGKINSKYWSKRGKNNE
jgi:hypothetical protein